MIIALAIVLALLGIVAVFAGFTMQWIDKHVGGFYNSIPPQMRKLAVAQEPKAAQMMALMDRAKLIRTVGLAGGATLLVVALLLAHPIWLRGLIVALIAIELVALRVMEQKATPLLKEQIEGAMPKLQAPQPAMNRAARRKAKKA